MRILPALVLLLPALAYARVEQHWSASGVQEGEEFGLKAGWLGDVNGDGFDDFLVGAPSWENSRGRALVYFGSKKGLKKKASWVGEGEGPAHRYGKIVGGLGDVNADGFADFFVVARDFTGMAKACGKVYVYHGGPGGPRLQADWSAQGRTENESFGDCAAPAGDLNGDGYADFAIGAFGYDLSRGYAELYLGSASGLSREAAWRFEGEGKGDWLGYGIGPAGDVNGDGFDDLLLGAKHADEGFQDAGKAYLFYGSLRGLKKAPDWSALGGAATELFSHRVDAAGDLNADGFADLLLSAPGRHQGRGQAMVYAGSALGPAKAPAWTVTGSQPGEGFGQAVGQAGDLDLDGLPDLLVAGPGHKGHGGVAAVYRGGRDFLEGAPAWTKKEPLGGSQFGYQAAQAGDTDGDGRPEWFVCAPTYGGRREDPGRVFLYQFSGPGGGGLQRLKSGKSWVFPGRALRAKEGVQGLPRWQYEFKGAGKAFDGKGLLRADARGSLDISGLGAGAWRWRARRDARSPWRRSADGRLGAGVGLRIVPEY